MLEVRNLSVMYGEMAVVDGLSFSVSEGQWLMIVGPNGAGKSTVINAVTQGSAYSGEVLLDGENMRSLKASVRAKKLGVLTQSHYVSYSFSVEEVVRLGRYAHTARMLGRRDKQADDAAVEEALAYTGLTAQRGQSVLTLSGGELQRTFLAQVFAQQPKLLLLDEPTNHLDLVYQKQVFSLITDWLKVPGRAVVSVVHDLSLAKAYGTHAVLLSHGKRVACGTVEEVLSPKNLDPVYDMDVAGWMRGLLAQWEEEK